MKTTVVEIECVGWNSRDRIELGNCHVKSIEVEIDHVNRIIQLNEYGPMPLVGLTTENKINYCKFEVFDDALGWYRRKIQTSPAKEECKFFQVQNGQLTVLGNFKDLTNHNTLGYFYGIVESHYSQYCSTYRIQARSASWRATKYYDWYNSVEKVKRR